MPLLQVVNSGRDVFRGKGFDRIKAEMTEDIANWDPMSIDEVADLMSDVGVPWWIAGGWAIDLFLGKQTRSHGDTDILIRRGDQLEIQAYLSAKGLLLYKTQQPGLRPWLPGEFQPRPFDDIWCRWSVDTPWTLQLMLLCTDGDQWVFKRDPMLRGPLDTLGRRSASGVPYMSPHIQLLYKAKPETLAKDQSDFDLTVPRLTQEERAWLLHQLGQRLAEDHPWNIRLREFIS